jgi:hypothetical protein
MKHIVQVTYEGETKEQAQAIATSLLTLATQHRVDTAFTAGYARNDLKFNLACSFRRAARAAHFADAARALSSRFDIWQYTT